MASLRARKEVASRVPTKAIRQQLLQYYEASKCRVQSADGNGYLCLIDRRNFGIFAVNGILNRPTYKRIALEAKEYGLDISRLQVYGTICTYSGPGLQFNNLP